MGIAARRLSRVQAQAPAGSPSASPGDYSGLNLWLKADAITGLTNGASVSSWADLSGGNNNATNASSTRRPQYITGVANGLPVVRFDGVDDSLASAVSSSLAQQTIVAVVRPTATTGLLGVRSGSGSGGLQLRLVDGMPQLLSMGVGEIGIVYDTLSTTQLQVLVATFSAGSSYSLWLDQTQIASGATALTLSSGLTSYIGSGSNDDYFKGDIAEIACYNRVLTNTEIKSLSGGLMTKWTGGNPGGGDPPAATVPGTARSVSISHTAGTTTARLSYTAPSSDGGSPITGYRVARDNGGGAESGPWSTVVSAGTLYYDFTSLKAGNTYALSVTPINAIGDGPTTSRTVAITADTPPPTGGIAEAIISDSFGNHDAVPRGVPEGYSWKYSADTNPNKSYTGFKSYGAVNIWGQIFVKQSGSPNYNVRVQVRNPKLYFFNGTTWNEPAITTSPMNGAYWAGNFDPAASSNATTRNDGGGLFSTSLAKLASGSPAPDVFHWWWDGMYPRTPIPSNAEGMLVSSEIRLILDGTTGTIPNTAFIAAVCADLFATPTTTIGPGGMNPGIPEPRMKYVTDSWQTFYDTTLSVAAITANPPSI